ncbi:MAG: MauE/DoxX family redox-associated membrane protein [Candidatus Hinthialibacter antarcticus]|nr:MauE/DoxX family redox-associated membrane protein [Candidatus Hinthialibacter antarcticus]
MNDSLPTHQSNRSSLSLWIELLLRVVLGCVLLIAGGLKLFHMPLMADSIINYQIMPDAYVNIVAIVLPPMEILVGIGLIAGLFYDGALLIATSLFAVFWISVAYAMSQGYDIDCGCFGTANVTRVGLLALGRNSLLLSGAVLLWVMNSGRCRFDNLCFKRPAAPPPESSPHV